MDLREDDQKLLDENPQPLDDADIRKAATWLLTAAAAVKKHAAVAMERRTRRESRRKSVWNKAWLLESTPTAAVRAYFSPGMSISR